MRILKTKQYELVEAKDIPDPFPPYAILSHTWISPKEEITYQDIKTRKEDIDNGVYKQNGWAKLKEYCNRAARDGWEWAWMDTCCIDKTNPADTQEAINAMFRWYQKAGICYAHLGDVDAYKSLDEAGLTNLDCPEDGDPDDMSGINPFLNNDEARKVVGRSLVKAKWFTRGWTLQELIAPHHLVFVDRSWRRIGNRENWAAEIKKASRIEPEHLITFKPTDFTSCSIAMRLSWASSRHTTVEEDETYSLIGLFGISLPLIYGEGRWRAFNRFQRELIMVYNDDSIFAWTSIRQGQKRGMGILAPSIREFQGVSQIKAFGYHDHIFSMTNRGLETYAKRWNCRSEHSKLLIQLNCGNDFGAHTGIMLRYANGTYERVQDEELINMLALDLEKWAQVRETKAILIRAGEFSDRLAGPSIFTLKYPEEITTHLKYFTDFNAAPLGTKLKLLDESSLFRLEEDEIFVQASQLIFVQIELRTENDHSMLDLIIYVNENGFPSVGIRRREHGGKQLGNPIGESSRAYQSLAGELYDKTKTGGGLPLLVVTKDNTTVGVHLLPIPPKKRSAEGYTELREYALRIYMNKRQRGTVVSMEHLSKRRKF